MGDARHKKPPPSEEEEDVTPEFREEVRELLETNATANRLRRLRKGDPGYLICNRAELADAIGTHKTMVNKIIGPKKGEAKVKLVDRSAFVGRIRDALAMASTVRITVRSDRAAIVQFIADLPDHLFKIYDDEYKRQSKR